MRYKILLSIVLLFVFAEKSGAQIVSGNAFLKGNFVEVGIGPCGTYGSSVDAPAGYHPRGNGPYINRLGFIADPNKDGWAVGSPNYCGDYFVPGTPEEGFGIQINGVNYNNNLLCTETNITGSVIDYRISGSNFIGTWQGTVAGVQITSVTSVPQNDVFFITEVTLRNTTASTLNNIYFMRNVDPDNEVTLPGGSYTTNNFVVAQNPNVGSRALVSATGLSYGCYLGLGTLDCRARVAFGGFSNRNPAFVWNGTGLSQSGSTTDDIAIAIAFKINSLAPGESTSFKFAHVLSAADLERALNLTVPTLQVNGIPVDNNSSINVCAGIPVPLQIINGSAYTFTWTPSTGLNTTTGSSVIATVNSSTTYTASGIDACGSTVSLKVTLNPSPSSSIGTIGAISGPTTICLPAVNQTYSVSPVPNAALYEWTVPSGVSIVGGDGTNSVQLSFSAPVTGNINVRARNGCGVTNTSTLAINASTSNPPVVSFSNITVTAPIGSTGTTVTYPSPVISSSLPITFTYTPASGSFFSIGTTSVSVTAINTCGSITRSFSVTVEPLITDVYYSKPAGDLQSLVTWGTNPDGTGANPPDFGAGKTFMLVNRGSVYTMTANWEVGGTVNIPTGSELRINGFTLSIASKTGTGTFSGSLTSNLAALSSTTGNLLLTFTPGSNSLNNLTINSGATAAVGSALDLYNTLTVAGFFTPSSDLAQRFMTFKSGPAMTARLAPVTGTIGNGDVTTETYIPARRAWRLINSPVNGPTSYSTAWREGAPINGNPYPGFGTHITGGPLYPSSTANMFDSNPVGAESSIKRYNNATNTWDPLPSLAGVAPTGATMLFIRGDRGIPLGYNNVPPTVTRLRDFGGFYIGPITRPVFSTGFTALPNPFQSPINFATLTRVNVQNNFYVWDPKMGGEFGVGAYVLISGNSSGTYDVIPASVSPESQYIQTNQSFMVRPETAGTAGSITFKESDKVATTFGNVFRTNGTVTTVVPNAPVIADPKSGQGLRITLETTNADKTVAVMDEVFTSYKSSYSGKVDDMDAVKMPNAAENLGIVREGQDLMLERKPLVDKSDVITLKLWNTTAQQYVLEFNPVNLNGTGLAAKLEDAYLRTSTPVSLTEASRINFTITSNPASARTDRFKVVLSNKNGVSDALTSTMGKHGITAYPNPIDGRNLTLNFNNEQAGVYQVRLVNAAGQVVFSRSVQHGGGTVTQTLSLNKKIQAGVYQLQVTGKAETANSKVISN